MATTKPGIEEAFPDPVLQYFTYDHLPGDLARVAQKFADLAYWVAGELPRGPERTVAFRKLLEAKDAARTRAGSW
jgi:hypothetical protein